MKYHLLSVDETLEAVGSTAEGISQEEAEKRLLENGKNKLVEGKKKTWLKRFVEQLVNPMIIVLLVAAAVNLATILVEYKGNPPIGEFAEFFIIVAVVLLNAILGVVQEGKAEQAVEALKQMTTSTCKVIRGGHLTAVKSEDIAVGDVIILEAGDSVPADCRIIVDTNHANSGKQYLEQPRIAKEVLHSCRHCPDVKSIVRGFMIESYLEDGCQKIGPDAVYGKSITDPCLGWEKTERLVLDIADLL